MPAPIVRLEKCEKVYRKDSVRVTALRGMDLVIHRGEYVVVMGPSGSGKSTLLNVLGCLDRLSGGRYLLDGEDVSTLPDDALSTIRSRKVGFIFQSYNLIAQLNVLENIEVPLYYQDLPEKTIRRRAMALAERLGLQDRLSHNPSELSGGQQQRVAIARSLISEPKLILADEPTGNLDSQTGEEILAMIDELNAEGRNIVLVTHDACIARRADRVLHLKDGALVSDVAGGAAESPLVAEPAWSGLP